MKAKQLKNLIMKLTLEYQNINFYKRVICIFLLAFLNSCLERQPNREIQINETEYGILIKKDLQDCCLGKVLDSGRYVIHKMDTVIIYKRFRTGYIENIEFRRKDKLYVLVDSIYYRFSPNSIKLDSLDLGYGNQYGYILVEPEIKRSIRNVLQNINFDSFTVDNIQEQVTMNATKNLNDRYVKLISLEMGIIKIINGDNEVKKY